MFKIVSPFSPKGDQPQAIDFLSSNIQKGVKFQTLHGVTGSGKTFAMAKIIERIQKPTLVISHNKTLASQLYFEFKNFFPHNAVHYFVSYYDYYQPEAYIPTTDTYIEKDAKINDEIDRLRHGATQALLTRPDVIIVASVSCIYNIGSPETYKEAAFILKKGKKIKRAALFRILTKLQYERNDFELLPGSFRARGELIEIFTPTGDESFVIEFFGDEIEKISRQSNFKNLGEIEEITIFPAKHFVTPQEKLALALENIKNELQERIAYFKKENKLIEAQRIKERTNYDLEMLKLNGFCPGIENYSRHLEFRAPGEPPSTLLDFFSAAAGSASGFLTFIDESHMTIPQIRGMYEGDRSRKQVLIDYGFRLPSALDNRPLKFEEFEEKISQTIYVSATPAKFELDRSKKNVARMFIRPTGLLDPKIELHPTKNQIHHILSQIKNTLKKKQRVLITTLTKRSAENLAEYLKENGIKAEYLHSEIHTLERPELLYNLRKGSYDVIVGVNLLREGLDLPEVSLVLILDADKEGFLRSESTLIQTIGRAARHIEGKVIMYADTITGSMRRAIEQTNLRRKLQKEYNLKNNIIPKSIIKEIKPLEIVGKKSKLFEKSFKDIDEKIKYASAAEKRRLIAELYKKMKKAAQNLNFEEAAFLRDKIKLIAAKTSS